MQAYRTRGGDEVVGTCRLQESVGGAAAGLSLTGQRLGRQGAWSRPEILRLPTAPSGASK